MSALLLIHKDSDGGVTNMRFAFQDGSMSPVIEQMADYLLAAGMGESVYENVAADRLGVILRQNVTIKELRAELAMWITPVVKDKVLS